MANEHQLKIRFSSEEVIAIFAEAIKFTASNKRKHHTVADISYCVMACYYNAMLANSKAPPWSDVI